MQTIACGEYARDVERSERGVFSARSVHGRRRFRFSCGPKGNFAPSSQSEPATGFAVWVLAIDLYYICLRTGRQCGACLLAGGR